ncbi:hypothetical protein N008_09790 [Hymenobacter sp. APR13]|nr:hypothetical protein N008_09790 [Hymenobacter sp. APR13]
MLTRCCLLLLLATARLTLAADAGDTSPRRLGLNRQVFGSEQPELAPARPLTLFWPGATLAVGVGVNTYGPLRYSNSNLMVPLAVDYIHPITVSTREHPTLGIRLRAATDLTDHRMPDPVYLPYTVQQPGRLALEAGLFLEGSPKPDLSLFVHGSTGLRLYPLLDAGPERWKVYDTFNQRIALLGAGLGYRIWSQGSEKTSQSNYTQLRGSLDYRRHWHDLSNRTERYYQQYVGPSTRLSSLHAHLGLTTWCKGKTGIELASNWYGRPANDPRTKYYDVRVSVLLRLRKNEAKTPIAPQNQQQQDTNR